MPPPFENMLEREVAHVLVHTDLSESTQVNLKAQLLARTSRKLDVISKWFIFG